MAMSNVQLWKQIQTLGKRNIYILAPALSKAATDPIQQLFVTKIRENKSAKVGGALEKELNTELERVSKQFGGGAGVDMTKFPEMKFTEPKVDPIDSPK